MKCFGANGCAQPNLKAKIKAKIRTAIKSGLHPSAADGSGKRPVLIVDNRGQIADNLYQTATKVWSPNGGSSSAVLWRPCLIGRRNWKPARARALHWRKDWPPVTAGRRLGPPLGWPVGADFALSAGAKSRLHVRRGAAQL